MTNAERLDTFSNLNATTLVWVLTLLLGGAHHEYAGLVSRQCEAALCCWVEERLLLQAVCVLFCAWGKFCES